MLDRWQIKTYTQKGEGQKKQSRLRYKRERISIWFKAEDGNHVLITSRQGRVGPEGSEIPVASSDCSFHTPIKFARSVFRELKFKMLGTCDCLP